MTKQEQIEEMEEVLYKKFREAEYEAVKEFAEKLKETAFDNCKLGGRCQEVVDCDDIDELLQ